MKLQLINISIVLECIRIYIEINLAILVASKKIGRYKEVLWISRALIVGHKRSLCQNQR